MLRRLDHHFWCSRPDLLDAALLRPGRLDRMLLCDFPTTSERAEILHVLSRKVSFLPSVLLIDVIVQFVYNHFIFR